MVGVRRIRPICRLFVTYGHEAGLNGCRKRSRRSSGDKVGWKRGGRSDLYARPQVPRSLRPHRARLDYCPARHQLPLLTSFRLWSGCCGSCTLEQLGHVIPDLLTHFRLRGLPELLSCRPVHALPSARCGRETADNLSNSRQELIRNSVPWVPLGATGYYLLERLYCGLTCANGCFCWSPLEGIWRRFVVVSDTRYHCATRPYLLSTQFTLKLGGLAAPSVACPPCLQPSLNDQMQRPRQAFRSRLTPMPPYHQA